MKAFDARVLVTATLSLMCAVAVGCAAVPAQEKVSDLAPRTLDAFRASAPRPDTEPRRPIVAVVLGGGGLRGFAHVGVLRALEDAGVKPDIVVGTSAGAVVGAAYASGLSPAQIDVAARSVKLSSLVDLTLSSSGIIRGDSLGRWVDSVTGHVPIEAFPIRFAAVATDLASQRPVMLDAGPAGRAVQASAAVPGINVPVPYRGGHLIDGGVTSLVPVRVARAMGADIVIAVDIYCNEPAHGGLAAPALIFRVMHSQSCLLAKYEMAEADIRIAPTVGTLKMSDKEQQARAVESGYEAAHLALAVVSAKLARALGTRVEALAHRNQGDFAARP